MVRTLIAGMLVAVLSACSLDPVKAAQRLVESGDKYLSEQKLTEAIIQYRGALAKNPDLADARLKLAAAYEAVGDLTNARFHALRAADQMPQSVEAQLRAGRLLMVAGQFAEAKSRAEAALEVAPQNVDALILSGNARARLKDVDGAISDAEQAIAADPQRTLSYANLGVLRIMAGDKEAAESDFKKAVEVAPKSPAAHVSLANYYWAFRRLEEAERELRIALDLEPNSPAINRALAAFYLTNQRRAEAEPYLKKYADVQPDVDGKLMLADYYLGVGKKSEARILLGRVVQEKAGFAPGKLRYAALDYVEGHRKESYEGIEEVLKRNPKDEGALLMKAGFLMKDQRAADALKLVESVVTANPNSVRGYFLKGELLASAGSSEEAIAAFQEALKLNPSAVPVQMELSSLFLARGDPATAVSYASQAVRGEPRSAVAQLLLAKAELRLGHVQVAEMGLMNLARSNVGDSAEVQKELGRLYWAKRDLPKARAAYSRALQLQADAVDALAGLVGIDLAEKKPAQARARIEAQLGATPDAPAVLLLAGTTFLILGDARRGESLLQHLLQVDPGNLDAYSRLSMLYLIENRLDEAKRYYEQSATHQTKPVVATTMIGIILEMQHKPDEARKQYEAALAMDPDAAVAANNLAMAYADRGGSLEDALRLAQRAKARMPDRPEIDDTLGWVYYKKGLPELAIPSFKQSLAKSPQNPGYLLHLGLAYAKTGDKVNARQNLEASLKIKSDGTGADEARRTLKSVID